MLWKLHLGQSLRPQVRDYTFMAASERQRKTKMPWPTSMLSSVLAYCVLAITVAIAIITGLSYTWCVCVSVCVHTCGLTTMHTQGGQRKMSNVLLYPSMAFSLESGCLTEPASELAASKSQWCPCLHTSQHQGCRHRPDRDQLFRYALGIKLRSSPLCSEHSDP